MTHPRRLPQVSLSCPTILPLQVRFATLRSAAAEEAATVTQTYLMQLCQEEDAKSDLMGSKVHMKNASDENSLGGIQYSG